jgi:hypothetical protein
MVKMRPFEKRKDFLVTFFFITKSLSLFLVIASSFFLVIASSFLHVIASPSLSVIARAQPEAISSLLIPFSVK